MSVLGRKSDAPLNSWNLSGRVGLGVTEASRGTRISSPLAAGESVTGHELAIGERQRVDFDAVLEDEKDKLPAGEFSESLDKRCEI